MQSTRNQCFMPFLQYINLPLIPCFMMGQITIDRNHDIHYDRIKNMIKGEAVQQTLNEKNAAYFSKYITFFSELRKSDLMKKYVFLWMTPSRYQELEDKFDRAKKDLKPNSNFIEFFPYHSGLILEIERRNKINIYISK